MEPKENGDSDFRVSTMCKLVHLKTMSSMNGKKCRIIGPYNEEHQGYPVFVFDTMEVVLIRVREYIEIIHKTL